MHRLVVIRQAPRQRRPQDAPVDVAVRGAAIARTG